MQTDNSHQGRQDGPNRWLTRAPNRWHSWIDQLTVAGPGRWRAPLLLALAGALLFLPLLGSFGLWDPHEVRVADAAKEVMRSPGWAAPSRATTRPPLPLWIIAAGFRFLGSGEIAGRLPIALLSILTLVACYWAGSGLMRRRGALFGLLALLTTPVFSLGARQLDTFVLQILTSMLAIGGLARVAWPAASEDDASDARTGSIIVALGLGILGLVLGFYTSGMGLGVAVPLAAIAVALCAVSGAPSGRREVFSLAALASLGIVGSSLWKFLGAPHSSSYSPILGGTLRPSTHQVEYLTLFRQIGFGAFPWITLLPIAVGRVFARMGESAAKPAAAEELVSTNGSRNDFARLALVLWVVFTYLADSLFDASVGELPYGAYAGIALLAGWLLDEIWEERALAGFATVITLVAAVILAHDFFMTPEKWAGAHVLEGIKWPGPLTREPYFFLIVGVLWAAVMSLAFSTPPVVAPVLSKDPEEPNPYLANENGAPLQRADRDAQLPVAAASSGPSRQSLVVAALGISLVTTIGSVYWIVPAVSHHLSYKGLFTKFQALTGASGGEIGRYHVPGQLSEYTQTTELSTLPSVFDFLGRPQRVFVIAAADDLAAIDQQAKSREQPGGTPSYYIVDDTNSRFLLLSNRLGDKEHDLNPLRRSILKALPKPPQHEVHADFEGKIELVGYDLPAEIPRGQSFKVTLYYKVNAPVAGAYKIFLHFDGQGTRFNGDHVPLEGKFPTNYWVPGYYIVDEHTMEADKATAPAGNYQIYGGFWLGEQRLKVVSGQSDGDNRVKIGMVRVK